MLASDYINPIAEIWLACHKVQSGQNGRYQCVDHRCAYRVHNVNGELDDEDNEK